MPVLIEGIDYEKHRGGYRLIKDQSHQTDSRPPNGKTSMSTKFGFMNKHGVLNLYAGFCWDGATYALDTDTIMRASVFHDWFCNNVNNKSLPSSYRREGDDLFYTIMLEDGMCKFRAKYAHIGVVAWGKMVVALMEED